MTSPIASLPMYDYLELRAATDAWWAVLARHLRDAGIDSVATTLCRNDQQPFGHEWRAPTLLFSQCCGYDLVTAEADYLQPVATPIYGAPGCFGPTYRSMIVVHRDAPYRTLRELHGGVCAINLIGSHSGYNALRYLLAPLAIDGDSFFSQVKVSGSHAESLALVVDRQADVAAIDCVSLALLRQCRPALDTSAVRTLAVSALAPALPYVTRRDVGNTLLTALRAGLRAALADPNAINARRALLLDDIAVLPAGAYLRIKEQARAAHALGYPTIA